MQVVIKSLLIKAYSLNYKREENKENTYWQTKPINALKKQKKKKKKIRIMLQK